MLSGVLKSDRAVEVNVTMMRTFVRLRQMLASHEDLSRKVEQDDEVIGILFEHVRALEISLLLLISCRDVCPSIKSLFSCKRLIIMVL